MGKTKDSWTGNGTANNNNNNSRSVYCHYGRF